MRPLTGAQRGLIDPRGLQPTRLSGPTVDQRGVVKVESGEFVTEEEVSGLLSPVCRRRAALEPIDRLALCWRAG